MCKSLCYFVTSTDEDTSSAAAKESTQRAKIADPPPTKSQIIKAQGIPILPKKKSDKSWIQQKGRDQGRGLYSSDQSVNRPARRPTLFPLGDGKQLFFQPTCSSAEISLLFIGAI